MDSIVSVVEDLAHDWLYYNKHSRHTSGVHGFVSWTVRLSNNYLLYIPSTSIVQCYSSDWPFKELYIIVNCQRTKSPKNRVYSAMPAMITDRLRVVIALFK